MKASAFVRLLSPVEEDAKGAGVTTPEERLGLVRFIDECERTHTRLVADAVKPYASWPHSTSPGENLGTMCIGYARGDAIDTLMVILECSPHLRAGQGSK